MRRRVATYCYQIIIITALKRYYMVIARDNFEIGASLSLEIIFYLDMNRASLSILKRVG
jgi:hypothetical protein